MNLFRLILSLSCVVLLAACGAQPAPTAAPVAAVTQVPTAGPMPMPTDLPAPSPSLPPTQAPSLPTEAPPSPTVAPATDTIVPPTATPIVLSAPAVPVVSDPIPQRIEFAYGATTAEVYGRIAPLGRQAYVLRVLAGQTLNVETQPGTGVLTLVIWGADGAVLSSGMGDVPAWSGVVPTSQDYFITVRNAATLSLDFALRVTVPPLPQPTVPPPQPVRRLYFAPGADTLQDNGQLPPYSAARYVIKLGVGRTLQINAYSAPDNQVTVTVFGADGTVLQTDHVGASTFDRVLPSTQDYYIDVRNIGPYTINYSVQVRVPPIAPSPAARRIQFAAGATSAMEYGSIVAPTVDRYVLLVMQGQQMTLQLSPNDQSVILSVYGADGTVLLSDHAGATAWSGWLPSRQDYYVAVQSTVNYPVAYTLVVGIPPR